MRLEKVPVPEELSVCDPKIFKVAIHRIRPCPVVPLHRNSAHRLGTILDLLKRDFVNVQFVAPRR